MQLRPYNMLATVTAVTLAACSANVTTREKGGTEVEVDQNSGLLPLTISVTPSAFLTSSPFRLIGVRDEIYLSVSADAPITSEYSFQCSFAGAAYASCDITADKMDVSMFSAGGDLCVKSSGDDGESFSEPVCATLPEFTSVSCSESVTANMSFEDFAQLLGENKTICLDDGVTVSNAPDSTFGRINITQSNVTLIARTGHAAKIHNQRTNTASYDASVGLYPTGDGFNVVGLTIQTDGSHGIVIYGPGVRNINIIANELRATGTTQRVQGMLLQGANDDIHNGNIIGNDIIAGDGDNSRGIELRYVDEFRVEDNSIETHCDTSPNNICPALYIKQSADKVGGPFHINRNHIIHSAQAQSYGIRLETASQEAVIASFNDNVIQLAADSASQTAIYSTTSVVTATGNTVCPLGEADFANLVLPNAPYSGNMFDKLNEASTQGFISLTEACP